MALGAELRAARQALGDLRARRARLAHPRRPPPAALHALSLALGLRRGGDTDRPHHRRRHRSQRRNRERLLPLLLRLERTGGPASRPPHVLLVHHGHGDARPRRRRRVRGRALAVPLRDHQGCEARRRLIRRSLGWDELGAAHEPLPRRGTLGRLRVGERREHPRHGRSDADSRRRARQGPDRRHRRELHGNARRLLRARVLPP